MKEKKIKQEKVRKVFLEELPKWESGMNKGQINWRKSIGYTVYFIYDDIEGDIEILDYLVKGRKLLVKYEDKIMKMDIYQFQLCGFRQLTNKYSSEFKIEIGARFVDERRNITIIDRKKYTDKNGHMWKSYNTLSH